MSKFLLDTDHFSLYSRNHPIVMANLVKHSSDEVSVSVITVQEALVGWLTKLNKTTDKLQREGIYRRMAQTVVHLAAFPIVPMTVDAMDRTDRLLRQKLNVGGNDLRIASIALDIGATVATRNTRDFSKVPGLQCVDWSA